MQQVEIPPSVLGVDDLLEVRVYLEESLTGSYRVDASGQIVFPLLGTLQVEGKTPAEVADEIDLGLRDGYLKDPQVSVSVAEFNSRKISVIGEVKSPGRYSYRDGMTIVEAIAEAGGTTPQALLASMQVNRRPPGEAEQIRYEVAFKEITQGRQADFPLLPGDVIVVQESAVK